MIFINLGDFVSSWPSFFRGHENLLQGYFATKSLSHEGLLDGKRHQSPITNHQSPITADKRHKKREML
jgi:hypothetical protein